MHVSWPEWNKGKTIASSSHRTDEKNEHQRMQNCGVLTLICKWHISRHLLSKGCQYQTATLRICFQLPSLQTLLKHEHELEKDRKELCKRTLMWNWDELRTSVCVKFYSLGWQISSIRLAFTAYIVYLVCHWAVYIFFYSFSISLGTVNAFHKLIDSSIHALSRNGACLQNDESTAIGLTSSLINKL